MIEECGVWVDLTRLLGHDGSNQLIRAVKKADICNMVVLRALSKPNLPIADVVLQCEDVAKLYDGCGDARVRAGLIFESTYDL